MGGRRTRWLLPGALALGVLVLTMSRARASGDVRALARGLGERTPEDRIRVVSELAGRGLRASAGELLLLARTDHEPAVLDALARTVRDAPTVTRPSANVRELVQWASAQTGA